MVRVRLRVESGLIGISLSTAGHSDLIREVLVGASADLQIVDVDIPDISKADVLIFRNASAGGPSRAVVQSVAVFKPD